MLGPPVEAVLGPSKVLLQAALGIELVRPDAALPATKAQAEQEGNRGGGAGRPAPQAVLAVGPVPKPAVAAGVVQLPRLALPLAMQRVAAVAGAGDARGAATAGTATAAGPAAADLDLPPAPRGAPPTPSAALLADN